MKSLILISALLLSPLASATENCDAAVTSEMSQLAGELSKQPEYEEHGGVTLDSIKALGETGVDGLMAYHAVLSVADFGLDLYYILVDRSCRVAKKTIVWKGDF